MPLRISLLTSRSIQANRKELRSPSAPATRHRRASDNDTFKRRRDTGQNRLEQIGTDCAAQDGSLLRRGADGRAGAFFEKRERRVAANMGREEMEDSGADKERADRLPCQHTTVALLPLDEAETGSSCGWRCPHPLPRKCLSPSPPPLRCRPAPASTH